MCSLQRKYFSSVTSTEGRVQILPTHRPAHRSEKRSAHWHQKSNCNLWTQSPHTQRDVLLKPIFQQKDAEARLSWLLLIVHDVWLYIAGRSRVYESLYKTAYCCCMRITEAPIQVMGSCRELFRGTEWVYDYDPLSTIYYAKKGAMRVIIWLMDSEAKVRIILCMYVMHECVSPCPGPKMCWVPCCCVS